MIGDVSCMTTSTLHSLSKTHGVSTRLRQVLRDGKLMSEALNSITQRVCYTMELQVPEDFCMYLCTGY